MSNPKSLVPFKKGFDERRNITGVNKGTRNFNTDFDEVVKQIAKENKLPVSQVRMTLLKVAYKEASHGSFSFFREIANRVYGVPDETHNVNIREQLPLDEIEEDDLI